MVDIIDIYNYLNFCNIKRSNNGFWYLSTLIQLCVEHNNSCPKMTELYEKVAEIYETTETGVERSIRYAIANQGLSNKRFITNAVFDLLVMERKRTACADGQK